MQALALTGPRAAEPCPSPVQVWQLLLTHLLNKHYGLTLNDTPFGDDRVIQALSMPVSPFVMLSISLWKGMNWCAETTAVSASPDALH